MKETLAGAPSSEAVHPGVKFVPAIKMEVPPREVPLPGDTEAIVAGGPTVKLKICALPASPSGLKTATNVGPTVPEGAVTAVMVDEEMTLTLVARNCPIWTAAPGWKFVPVMVTGVPPVSGPDAGVTDATAGTAAKIASTAFDASIVMAHGAVCPLPAPDHPVKTEPADATGVSVTSVPGAKVAEHVGGQAMPPGSEETVPLPVPIVATDRANWATVVPEICMPSAGPCANST